MNSKPPTVPFGIVAFTFFARFLEIAVYAKVVRRGPTVYLPNPRFKSKLKIRRLTFSPLVSLQSTAWRTAFSRGSPTKLSSRKASEWHEASTCAVSSGISVTAHTSSSSLQIKRIIKSTSKTITTRRLLLSVSALSEAFLTKRGS